jgi:hypothetical protein
VAQTGGASHTCADQSMSGCLQMERPAPFRGPGPSLSQQALALLRSSPRESYTGSYADSYAGSGAPSPHGSHHVPELETVSLEPSPRMSVASLPPITQQEKPKPSWLLPWWVGRVRSWVPSVCCVPWHV